MDSSKFLVKSVLNDILRGFSFVKDENLGDLFIKHLTIMDQAEIDEQSLIYFEEAKLKEIPDFKTNYSAAIKNGTWSIEKETSLNDQKTFLNGLHQTKKNLIYEEDIENIQKDINESAEKIKNLESEKFMAIGPTIENYVDNRVRELFVLKSFFIDKEFKNILIKNDKEVSSEDLMLLINVYNKIMSKFNIVNIKKASLNENYLSPFCLCDNDPFKFYGRAIMELSTFQIDLFIYAAKFKSIISEWQDIPKELLEDPEKLEEQFSKRENVKKIIDKNKGKGNLIIPGMDNQDLEELGLGKAAVNNKRLMEATEKAGGTLDMETGMKLGVF